MLSQLKLWQRNVFIILIMFIYTYLGYSTNTDSYFAGIIWPSIGIALGLYFMFGKKALLSIFTGIFIATLIARVFLLQEELYIAFGISLFLSLINIIEVYLFKFLMDKSNALGRIDYSSGVYFYFFMLIVSVVGAILSVTTLGLFYDFNNNFSNLFSWAVGEFTGMAIFGTIILILFFFDDIKPTRNKTISGIVFTFLFVATCILQFSNLVPIYTYANYGFVFIVFFFIAAFVFTYRMILVISSIFLFSYQLLYLDTLADNVTASLYSLNIFLFTLTYIAIITRLILYTLQTNNEELTRANQKMDRLIDSTNKLFRIKDIEINSERDNIKYIKEIFQIALSLYDSYDAASCYIQINDAPIFIDAKGYDIDELNNFEFDNASFQWAMNEPQHIVNAERELKIHLGSSYEEYSKVIPYIKESIRFGVYIDDNFSGGMSFDNFATGSKKFTKLDFDNFNSFQRLMNSFYEINYLNTRNLNFKNDIVLSLIKTLELYDQYTSGHSEEVAAISREIAIKMDLSEKEIYDIYWAGVVHDIGKVGISSSIINKDGKLSQDEYETIKEHPIFGANILKQSEDLVEISDIVKHHHEWWNGNGYPNELSKENIPLGSQILCVADAVSAMSGARKYSNTKATDAIIDELSLYAGVQFNPKIAMIMIELLKDGILDRIKKS